MSTKPYFSKILESERMQFTVEMKLIAVGLGLCKEFSLHSKYNQLYLYSDETQSVESDDIKSAM